MIKNSNVLSHKQSVSRQLSNRELDRGFLKRTEHLVFYDIESLENIFLLSIFKPQNNDRPDNIEIYYLADTKNMDLSSRDFFDQAIHAIYVNNKNFNGDVQFYDLRLKVNTFRLAKLFGVCKETYVNNITPNKCPYRIICDTDPNYDEEYSKGNAPFLCGYNSQDYDMTMLAWFFSKTCFKENGRKNTKYNPNIKYDYLNPDENTLINYIPTNITANTLYQLNSILFNEAFHSNMASALQYDTLPKMRAYIRYRKDDRQFNALPALIRKNMLMTGRYIDVAILPGRKNFLGLKRALGQLGYQILESELINPNNAKIKTPKQLYDLIAYNVSDVVNLEYLFYNDTYKASFDLKRQFLQTYKELVYEAQDNAYNQKSFHMVDPKTGNFDEEHHAYAGYAPNVSPQHVRKDRLFIDSTSAKLASMALCPYGNLDDIETVNFMYPAPEEAKMLGIESRDVLEETKAFVDANFKGTDFEDARNNFQYIYDYYANFRGKNFNNSSTYAEKYNLAYKPELTPHDPSLFINSHNCIPYYDVNGKPTSCYANFSIGGIHGAEYNKQLYDSDMEKYRINSYKYKYPKLFKPVTNKKGELSPKKLNEKYTFTSTELTNHEDFTSYYPNLLRHLRAFWNNGLGFDRYGMVFNQKQLYGKLMKDQSLSEEERHKYAIQREGTKLILNSASGAADANHNTSIRMNNRILSMRIIGELFTWRIAQAQALHGARIISTNTDGLYSVLEENLNNKILHEQSKTINVEIEPELTYLITKDSNNRLEATKTFKITSSSGGDLSCFEGPNPLKSLDHPAVCDWVLNNYLISCASGDVSIFDPFDRNKGLHLLKSALQGDCTKNGAHGILKMFQMMTSSNPSVRAYVFGTDDANAIYILQRYNRCFIVNSPDQDKLIVHLQKAVARKATKNSISDTRATQILEANGLRQRDIPSTHITAIEKINKIEPDWYCLIENHNLSLLNHDYQQWILNNLNLNAYLDIIETTYNKNWMNEHPKIETIQQQMSLF